MACLHSIKRIGLGLICAGALPLALGCQSTKKISVEIHESLFTATPEPAANLGCMWKKQIAHLPDPSKDSVMSPGMVGLANLYSADGLPTKVDGDLQIHAYDETPRKPGQSAQMSEGWLLDATTLRKKLATRDDRGMDCYALFLPWPKNWTDVTKVRIQVKYIPKNGGTEITSSDQTMIFEFPTQGAAGGGILGNAVAKSGPKDMQSMPDLKKVFKQQPLIAKEQDVVSASAIAQPIVQPIIIPANVQTPMAPAPLPANAPVIVSQEVSPMPLPTPPPPPAMPRALSATPMVPANATPTNVGRGESLPALEIPAAR